MEAIRKGSEDPAVKVYLKFLKYILPIINQMNRLLQSETPELCRLHGEISRLYRTVLDNFLKPEYMAGIKELSKIVLNQQNYKHLEKVFIGTEGMQLMAELLRSQAMNLEIAMQITSNIISVYITLCHQINTHIDLSDPALIHLAILDPHNVVNRKFESIFPLSKHFLILVKQSVLQSADTEYREVRNIDFEDFKPDELKNSVTFRSRALSKS